MTTTLAYIPSPAQGVWQLGPIPIRAYALCIIAGIVVALVLGDRRWAARGGERGVIYDIALWAVPFGLIGGRVYHVLTDWRTYFGPDGAGFVAALRIWDGGLGIWGAVALGGVGAWIACRRHGIPLPAFGDAIAPGIVLAQAIGRLGNYFNQELYGRPTTLPWGLEIYERRNASGALDPLNGTSTGELLAVVHPTFLYEMLWNVLVFVVLIWADRRFRLGHGRLFALYVAGYCVGRFWVELLRSDFATHIAGIRINSFTASFVFIGAVVYIMVAPKGREDPATLGGPVQTDAGADTGAAGADAEVDTEVDTEKEDVAAAVRGVAGAGAAPDLGAEALAAGPLEAEALTVDVLDVPDQAGEAGEIEEAGEEAGMKTAEWTDTEEFAEAADAELARILAEALEADAEEPAPNPGPTAADPVPGAQAAAAIGNVGAAGDEDAERAEAAAAQMHEAVSDGTLEDTAAPVGLPAVDPEVEALTEALADDLEFALDSDWLEDAPADATADATDEAPAPAGVEGIEQVASEANDAAAEADSDSGGDGGQDTGGPDTATTPDAGAATQRRRWWQRRR